ncbi:hypothetical protein GCM10009733_024030 [Nonomuraea maheshkhaliensis]|uniref:Core-binding (CB) domain-containing protein n=1 Tax=Nonomuraea maheshkhaliensis TaxID=419590 RepID=A0ABN2F1X0_9ACTN
MLVMPQNLDYLSHWPTRPDKRPARRRVDRSRLGNVMCHIDAPEVLVSAVPFPTPPADPPPPDTPQGRESVAAAVDRYLDGIKTKTTRAGYAETLARLTAHAGARDTGSLTPDDYAAVMARWDSAAVATWNRHLSALTSFTAWAQRQEILAVNPGRRLERRKPARRGDRSIPLTRLEKLFTDDGNDLRERVLWRMLYETAARADEILSLNIEDLDLEFRRGRVTSKGGAVEYVHWATGTALPRLLRGRTSGPVFLADRRAPHLRASCPRGRRRLPDQRTRTAVLPTRRIPIQTGHRQVRPTRQGLDTPPTPAQRPTTPGSRRTHRPRTPSQIPPPAPGRPRPLRQTRRRNLSQSHRRGRPSSTPPNPLTCSYTRPATGPFSRIPPGSRGTRPRGDAPGQFRSSVIVQPRPPLIFLSCW